MRGKMRPWAPAPILMTTGTWWLLGTYVDGCGWLEYQLTMVTNIMLFTFEYLFTWIFIIVKYESN